jgi:hypothetical protein
MYFRRMTQAPDPEDLASVRFWVGRWGDEVAGADITSGVASTTT